MTESSDHIINKLIDLIKQAFRLRENPDLICGQSRKSSEAILREVYKREVGPVPPKIMFQSLLDGIRKRKVIPHEITLLFETVNKYGNMTLHPDDELSIRTINEAKIVESNLSGICNWFFNSYLRMETEVDLFTATANNSTNTAVSNYEDLIKAALADHILDLDEYESILQARQDLGLRQNQVSDIERQLCLEILGMKVDGIIDVLSNADLHSFKKLDQIRENRPAWVLRCLENVSAMDNIAIKNYISYYFEEVFPESSIDGDPLESILGCWQGWYFQHTAKTYYDLMFIAKSETEFIGLSIEPINPTWNEKGYEDPYLLAWIDGSLVDDIIFSYEKTMILEKTWTVDYEGVIIENGQLFEGEWNVESLNGSFNAMRSRSLLPIRIFDNMKQHPIVNSTYLNKNMNLTSSWLIQLMGKKSTPGIMHVIELRRKLYANIILPTDESMGISYCEGQYDETAKATIHEINAVDGKESNFKITFTIDWNNQVLNGTMKDDIHRMRVFKAFKI